MKFKSLSEDNRMGGDTLSKTIRLLRPIVLFAMLVVGGISARASGPVLTTPESLTVGEDSSSDVDIGLIDTNAAIFTVTTTATSSNTNLISNSSLAFSGGGTNRLLSIKPKLHQYGAATITVIAGDSQPAKTTNTIALTVTYTNYPPVFLKVIGDLTRNENAPSTNFSFTISDVETPAAGLIVTATSSNTTLVPNTNLVLSGSGTNRTLILTQAPNENGSTLIELVVTDGGGATATNDFTLTVWAVNQAPTLTMLTNRLSYVENYGRVTISNFVTNVTSGPPDQSGESNYFVLKYTTNFYITTPAIDTNGTLTFQVATNQFGTNTITVVLFNAGSTTNGGKNSLTNTVTLDVPFVNQAPGFALSTNLVVMTEETLSVTNIRFLTNVSVGPTNESSQTWTFTATTATNNATNAAFTVLPAIATNGTLTFKPAAHSFGTNLVTVVMTDSGGTNNGGINTYTNSFQIAVAQTNHAPTIVVATNFTVLENGTNIIGGTNGLMITVNVWDYDTVSTNLTLVPTSSNTNLTAVSVTGTNVPSSTNAVFSLTFAPVTNANGSATIQLVAAEGALSTTNTLKFTVTPVNQAPSFGLSTNLLLVTEETLSVTNIGFLTNLLAGPTNEITQSWKFTTTTVTNNATNAAFTVLPAIATNGTLTFKPAAHSFGTNLVTVVMTDSGGTNNGGINTYSNTFLVGVVQTNHPPTAVFNTNYTVLENGTNIIGGTNGLTITVNVWDYDTVSTNLTLVPTSSNTNLTAVSVTSTNVPSSTNAVFSLTFAPVTNANGVATIQLVAAEGAQSTTNTFKFTITPVNQAPSFGLSTNLLLVTEETLSVTNVAFLTNLLAGPTNEITQSWTFKATTVTNNATNAAFTVVPAIATNGTLTFKPAAHSFGTNLVTIVMTDSGGTNNGGINTYSNTFLIGVVQTNHPPTIVFNTNYTVLENGTNIIGGTNGLSITVNVWDYDTVSTNLTLVPTSSNTNLTAVSVTGTNVPTATNAVFTLTFAPVTNANGAATITLVAAEGALSTTNTFKFTVTPVNQAPSFGISTNLSLVTEETLSVTNVAFLTNLLAGPTNEITQSWTFKATTVTNNATNAAFTVLPAIATNGTLTFKPAAHSFGTNLVTIVMTDSGGTNNGGVNTFSNTFLIGVVQTNHSPTVVFNTNYTVLENGTNIIGGTNALSITVNVWDYDTVSTNLTLVPTSSNTNLTALSVTGTNVPSATNAVFTLTFAPVTNANGAATITLVAAEGALSTTNTFKFTVTPVNQAPSFGLSTNLLLVTEETLSVTNIAFLTNLLAGPTNEIAQSWKFTTTTVTNNATNAAFTVLPAIATNGTLTFKPAAHSFGTNLVTIVMTDSGGTNNGGINTSSNTFLIGVVQTNHAPTAVFNTNYTVLENGTNIIGGTNGLTITVNVWDYDTVSTNLTLVPTSSNTNLTAVSVTSTNVPSSTNAVFSLTFAPVTNANGAATITLVAAEGALSTTNTFKFTVTPVNQAPSFGLSTNLLLVTEETLSVTNVAFLTNLLAGPTNEITQSWTFTTTTVTNNATNAAFTVLPAIATNGTLTFKPAAHSFGTNLVTIVMTDSGGTNNGGINTSSNTFLIGVVQTNHAPTIVFNTNYTALENGTNIIGGTNGLTITVNVWDYDKQSTNLVLVPTSLNTNLTAVSLTGTNVPSVTNTVFSLTFAPVANSNGVAAIQLVASEGALSTTNTFNFTVTPVNQAPSFGLSTNTLVVAENAGVVLTTNFLTNLLAGPPNEITQSWTFTVSGLTNNATNATFANSPTIATNGALSFRTATNSFGTNLLTVVMTDSGGTNNGGINTYSNSFQLQVTQVPYPPAFQGVTNSKTILENATTNLGLAFTLYDPLTTNFTVTCVSSNTNLVTVSLTGSNTMRTLLFAPVTNQFGTTTVNIRADDGSLTNSTNISVTIVWVNQAPSFTLNQTNLTVDKYDAAVSRPNAVTNILAGPTNESSQTVSFTVTNSSPSSFLVPPSVDSSGTLAFTPGATGGTVTVGIKAVDDGGAANGGSNTSPVQTMTITIPANPFPYLTGPFAGLFYDTNAVTNASSGYFNLLLTTNGTYTGYLLCAGGSNTFSGQFDISNSYSTAAASDFVLDLTIDTSGNWTETVSGSVSNTTANWSVPLQSYLVGFSASFPTPLAGEYLMAMPGFADASDGPGGDSILSLIISNNGFASLTGYTADDTYFKQSSQISVGGYYPLYAPLYGIGASGSIFGWLNITGALSNSVSTNSILTWINETGATTLYPAGFTNQAVPLAALYDSTLGDLLSFSSGTVILSGGNLATPITNAVTVSANQVIVDPSATNGLTLTINRSTGEVTGSFVIGNNVTNSIYSVMIQNTTNVVEGYFLGTSQGGSFIMFGN